MKEQIFEFVKEYQKYLISGLIIGTLVIGLFCFPVRSKNNFSSDKIMSEVNSSKTLKKPIKNDDAENRSSNTRIYVDIKGSIHHPGAYLMNADQRIGDVIVKAGGYTDDADEKQINLAQKITDQMVIYVPHKGEKILIQNQGCTSAPTTSLFSQAGKNSEENKVNLNNATLEQLKELNGIGEKKAQKIIEYRQQHGSFKKVEELKQVNGIGEKSYESLANQVCV